MSKMLPFNTTFFILAEEHAKNMNNFTTFEETNRKYVATLANNIKNALWGMLFWWIGCSGEEQQKNILKYIHMCVKGTHISIKIDPKGSTPPNTVMTAGSMNLKAQLHHE